MKVIIFLESIVCLERHQDYKPISGDAKELEHLCNKA
jgi:hypothetical protein